MAKPSFSRLSLVPLLLVALVNVTSGQGGGDGETFGPERGAGGTRRELVPALFIFGDSLIDNGNNNNLPSFAKANYYPYGIDFQGGATGRFSNGYTMVDEIAELLGLPLIPAYSEASGEEMLHGVNYASAAAGILDITGRNFVGRIPFNQQIRNYENTLDQITDNLGADDAARSIARCIFFVGMGSNDYLNNYLMPNYPTQNQYSSQQFADLLVQQYTTQLTRLYNLGARKFVVAGLGLMGCIPNILAQDQNGRCSDTVNQLVLPFNSNVKTMINNLNADLPGAKFIYIDVYRMFYDILTRPTNYGFSVIDRGCCGVGRNSGQITCLPFETPCSNRNQYVFWDAFHPTERVNVIMGRESFSGNSKYVYPMNIQQLANLDLPTN
ncbi:PREDICTED: GDSL esterase/lipase At1g71691-like [Nelumbo nucifera]|uniref:GDSL esterase/lipase At1g71691-like n=1 Tax=Nelumbo nucifera TaxID=4432 RepID=A0A1U8AEW2_NELNU|nr:PREDICTED: GDSL esterase/lipase At1g71691-like [Nelumbo nucifera]